MFVTHLTGFNADLTFPVGSHGSGGESYLKNVPALRQGAVRTTRKRRKTGREREREREKGAGE